MNKIPYKFDIRTGHYVYIGYLNEGEAPIDGQETSEDNKDNAEEDKGSVINLESAEVVQLKQNKETKLASFDNDIQNKEKVINQIKTDLANSASQGASQAVLNGLQKKILQAQYELENKKFEKLKSAHELECLIIQAKQKLVESNMLVGLPIKYKMLSESNIHNAKIYIDKLVDDDQESEAPIKDMRSFKKVFKKSNLLYGKDSTGYFAVCVDKQDFEKITDTLEEVGYLRTDIIDAIMPQLFNRSDMVK